MHILFAEGLGGLGTIALGLLILGTAFLLRKTGVRAKSIRKRNVTAELRREFAKTKQEGRSELDSFAVRLHDYAREVDAMTQTRIATLRELTAAADHAVAELQSQLADKKMSDELSSAQSRIAILLAEAGHSASTIAALLNRSESEVRGVIENAIETQQPDAA